MDVNTHDFVTFVIRFGGATLFLSFFLTIVFCKLFKIKIKELDDQLYVDFNCHKFFFFWDKNYKKFVFELGYKSYNPGSIKNYARTLYYIAVIGTQGFMVSVIVLLLYEFYLNFVCAC